MEHRIYKIFAFASFLIILVLAALYDCFSLMNIAFDYRLAIKVLPMIVLMILTFIYMYIYRVTIYSVLLMISLILGFFRQSPCFISAIIGISAVLELPQYSHL